DDRWITGHLYGGDQDTRIRQEIVLGIGGARLLRTLQVLGIECAPAVYHLNEGHSAFVALELARERLASGAATSFATAHRTVASRLAFTTHTPVSAGHDTFPAELVEAYFSEYREQLGLSQTELMALGQHAAVNDGSGFSMTVLALRSAHARNGVSQLHGAVSRRMWRGVGVGVDDAPPRTEMEAITNGVHSATWAGPDMSSLFDDRMGTAWRTAPHKHSSWQRLTDCDSTQLWSARTAQRGRLLERVDAAARTEGLEGLAPEVTADRALVLGFARRFATYKRAGLLLEDPDRLWRLLAGDPTRPVVLVFAGKAHPRDEAGKRLVQRIVEASRDERFRGRIVFLENYGVELARLLVQGSDVWLNTPRRPEEASGTSGMKAALNGALNVSELDGWWDEAYAPGIGWPLGDGMPQDASADEVDRMEACQLMETLEHEVVPLFFARDPQGVPVQWLGRVVRSIETLAGQFSAHRMLQEYVELMYRPAGAQPLLLWHVAAAQAASQTGHAARAA
ncbi:MAG: alpha-glucan family phosphorylase, partial [Chloroflexi bacterium]|nr:alpha-glucan family phosphorylase [Chloroflexota bacterium]